MYEATATHKKVLVSGERDIHTRYGRVHRVEQADRIPKVREATERKDEQLPRAGLESPFDAAQDARARERRAIARLRTLIDGMVVNPAIVEGVAGLQEEAAVGGRCEMAEHFVW